MLGLGYGLGPLDLRIFYWRTLVDISLNVEIKTTLAACQRAVYLSLQ
jgi:hypothetical protein